MLIGNLEVNGDEHMRFVIILCCYVRQLPMCISLALNGMVAHVAIGKKGQRGIRKEKLRKHSPQLKKRVISRPLPV